MPYPTPLASLPEAAAFDVVVLGAGGAGMSAALFAAIAGAKVLLVESTSQVGGTTAYSAATTWVPGTHLAPQVKPDDSLDNAARFLDHAVGSRSPRALRDALLAHGAQAVKTIEDSSRCAAAHSSRFPSTADCSARTSAWCARRSPSSWCSAA
jgi:phytoene dehydrogenase-like protein